MIPKVKFREIVDVLDSVKDVLAKTSSLVELEDEEFIVVGDLHGDLEAYLRVKKYLERSPETPIIFLGDYVDRGPFSLEITIDIFRSMLQEDRKMVVLRGNHETYPINDYYGFRYELARKLAGEKGEIAYKMFNEAFSLLPVACLVNKRMLAVHGGIPNPTVTIEQIKKIPKGDMEASDPILFQLLWNDPTENVDDWAPSPRGPGIYLFGRRPLEEFMNKNDIKLVIRGHLFLRGGYKTFFNGKLISIFSSLNYVGETVNGKIVHLKDMDPHVIDLIKV